MKHTIRHIHLAKNIRVDRPNSPEDALKTYRVLVDAQHAFYSLYEKHLWAEFGRLRHIRRQASAPAP